MPCLFCAALSCARMLATLEGNLQGYALGVRHQLAPGTDQLGASSCSRCRHAAVVCDGSA